MEKELCLYCDCEAESGCICDDCQAEFGCDCNKCQTERDATLAESEVEESQAS